MWGSVANAETNQWNGVVGMAQRKVVRWKGEFKFPAHY